MPDSRNRLGSGAIWSLLDNLAQQVLSFLVFLVLARFVAPAEFGLIAIAHVIVAFARQTVFNAIAHPVARAESPTNALYSAAFCICCLASLVMSAIMLAGAGLISGFYGQPDLVRVLSWMSLVVLVTGMSAIFEIRLVRQMEFRPLAIRSIVSVTIGGIVGIALALRGAGVMALVAQQVVTSCLALALLIAQARWLPSIEWSNTTFRKLSPDMSRVGLTGLFSFLASQGDTVLVSVFMGSYATGIYSFAKRLTSAIYLVIGSSLLKLAIPAFAEAAKSPDTLRDAYVRILGISIFLMAPLLAGLSVLAKPMISVFFGAIWAPAATVVALLAMLNFFLVLNQTNDFILFAVGERTAPVQRGFIQTGLALLLGWIGSTFGLSWTAAGFVLASALVWPSAQRLANNYMNFGFLKLGCALKGAALATTLMSLFLWTTLTYIPFSALSLMGMVVAGAVVFFLAHRIIIKFSPSSHDALKDLVHLRRPAPR